MGLLAQEIRELRQIVKQYENGGLTDQQVTTRMKVYKEVRERVKLMMQALLMQAQLANRPNLIENKLHSLNVLDLGEAVVENNDLEISAVKCPDQADKIITRADCLAFSGDVKNIGACKTCANFKHTRALLLEPRYGSAQG